MQQEEEKINSRPQVEEPEKDSGVHEAAVPGPDPEPEPELTGNLEVLVRETPSEAAERAKKEHQGVWTLKDEEKHLSKLAIVSKLDVGGKQKLARNGDKEYRGLLIKDSNRQVALAVLGNPKMTIQEIEVIAASRNVSEEILREIAGNRDWIKQYNVVLSLVNNPKCPVALSISFLPRILLRDLRSLLKSKGIPDALRVNAKRILDKKQL
jgi:hypothetical protein